MRNWLSRSVIVGAVLLALASTAHADLNTARRSHTATLLPSGQVLVVGGWNGAALDTAELYNPANGSSTDTESLVTGRTGASATLLRSGLVLIAGGQGDDGSYLNSAELYDPATGTFSETPGSLVVARRYHTATLLASGEVLLVGGRDESGYLTSAEVYDPASGTFTSIASELGVARGYHTATLLASGRVLLAGGTGAAGRLSSAELYDPASGFATTGAMSTVRMFHSAVLLPSGLVLMAGGIGTGNYLTTAELYDPASGAFTATGSLTTARYQHTASLLPSGRVLIAGGYNRGTWPASLELYDPSSGAFTSGGNLASPRIYHTVTVLPSSEVLVVGGSGDGGYLASTEQLDLALPAIAATGPLGSARGKHTATLLPSGSVLLAGGDGVGGPLSSSEIFNPASGTATEAAGELTVGRAGHTATLLASGEVLIAGGFGPEGVQGSSDLYLTTDAIVDTGELATPRASHTATLLASGRVLIAGGEDGVNPLDVAEVYDSATRVFVGTGSLSTPRTAHTATLLASGEVLVSGGWGGNTLLSSAELYDAASGTFAESTGSLLTARMSASATLLPSGMVLIAGGEGLAGEALASAELYDPATDTFTATGALGTGRRAHTATLLRSGRVLIAGGLDNNGESLNTAELYEPASGLFSPVATPLGAARHNHTATLLSNGRVYLVAGLEGATSLSDAEIYDEGLAYQTAWAPLVTSATNPAVLGSPVVANGSRFTGLHGSGPESSASGTQASATNYPLLQLQRIDNGQVQFLPLDPTVGFSSTSFASSVDWAMTPGPALATLITNGIPSPSWPTLVCEPFGGVSISLSGSPTVCGGAVSGGTLTVAESGGGVVAHRWGYRTAPEGATTTISGQTGVSYTLNISDFPGSGIYYVVVIATPLCGEETASNEVSVILNSAGPTATSTNPIYVGDTLQLEASEVPGGIFSWAGPNGFSSAEQNPLIPGVTAAASGTYSVTSSLDSCVSAPGVTDVFVDPHTLSIASFSGTEVDAGTSNLGFVVTLSEASASTVTVNYATRAATATTPADFVAANGVLTFAPGQTTKYIWIGIVGDSLAEVTETFHVDLSLASGAGIAGGDGVGTILDNDFAQLSVADVSVTEGDSGSALATFSVTLSRATDQTVTVHYATVTGSATSGVDYVATSGDLSFNPGDTERTISVPVNGDLMDEPSENFHVQLSDPVYATIARNGTATIEDNDSPPQISINDVSVVEGNYGSTNLVFSVSLSAPSAFNVDVSYATADGTALAGSDYSSKTSALAWPAGTSGSQSVVIGVLNDLLTESTEAFYLNLTSPMNATISNAQGVGTITDNDESWPVLTVSDPTVVEADSGTRWVAFTLSLSKASTVPVLVTFATTDGTAVAGADYVAKSGGVSFSVGVTSRLVYVYTIGDTLPEGTETFNLAITGANQVTLGDSGVCTITDNDS